MSYVKLRRTDLLTILMEQTKDGRAVSLRDLGAAAGVSHNTMWRISTGAQARVKRAVAEKICDRIGCAVPVLWSPADWDDTDNPTGGMSE